MIVDLDECASLSVPVRVFTSGIGTGPSACLPTGPSVVGRYIHTGCLEKKFTQEILNKILSFWCTRLIFTRAYRKVGRSAW